MDAHTADLAARLQALGLCTPRDLRRCRARVRRLCRDLPLFDSVWLDALVQAGTLTPFQSRLIASGDPSSVSVGPLILVDRIDSDGRWTNYTARRPPGRDLVHVTIIDTPAAALTPTVERWQSLIDRLHDCRDERLAVPQAVHVDRGRIVVLSRWSPGSTLAELLVRRGRFPIPVVLEIARELASALDLLAQHGNVHGDLRLRHVRLDIHGRLRLTQVGTLAALEPTVSIHADIPPDAYDGIAPELIDSHVERQLSSDLYACGCLLWQLLAGRPPFALGDPLSRLAAHQTRRVPDIREWTPETPAPLAELLLRLTSRDIAQRPRSYAEILDQLGRPTAASRRRLRRFVRSYQSAAPRHPSPVEIDHSGVARFAATAAVVLMLASTALLHSGVRSELLRIASDPASLGIPSDIKPAAPPAAVEDGAALRTVQAEPARPAPGAHPALQPLPVPDRGIIELTSNGPYAAGSLSAVGPLTIRGAPGTRPVVVVADQPLILTGTTVILQNIALVRATAVTGATVPLVDVRAQDCGLVDCLLHHGTPVPGGAGRLPQAPPAARPACITWQSIDPAGAVGGRFGLQRTAFIGDADAVVARSPLQSMQAQQVLHVGRGVLLHCESRTSTRPLRMNLTEVTLRGNDGLVSLDAAASRRPPHTLISVDHCLFAPAIDSGLVELRRTENQADPISLPGIEIGGAESFLLQGAQLAAMAAPSGSRSSLDADLLELDGLQYADLRFAGELSNNPEDARLLAPRGRVGLSAGCNPAVFAPLPDGSYNLP